jgi:hypothetical protein
MVARDGLTTGRQLKDSVPDSSSGATGMTPQSARILVRAGEGKRTKMGVNAKPQAIASRMETACVGGSASFCAEGRRVRFRVCAVKGVEVQWEIDPPGNGCCCR